MNFRMSLYALVAAEQDAFGLRTGDHARYARHCAAVVRGARSSSLPEAARRAALFDAERAWARAMALRAAAASGVVRRRSVATRQAVRRWRRAAMHADRFGGDGSYAQWMRANGALEARDWGAARAAFAEAACGLRALRVSDERAAAFVCERAAEADALARYASHMLGDVSLGGLSIADASPAPGNECARDPSASEGSGDAYARAAEAVDRAESGKGAKDVGRLLALLGREGSALRLRMACVRTARLYARWQQCEAGSAQRTRAARAAATEARKALRRAGLSAHSAVSRVLARVVLCGRGASMDTHAAFADDDAALKGLSAGLTEAVLAEAAAQCPGLRLPGLLHVPIAEGVPHADDASVVAPALHYIGSVHGCVHARDPLPAADGLSCALPIPPRPVFYDLAADMF